MRNAHTTSRFERAVVAAAVLGLTMVTAARPQQVARPFGSSYIQHHPEIEAIAAAKTAAGRQALALGVHSTPPQTTTGTYVTFDVSGASTGFLQGTTPVGINNAGVITGYYADSNSLLHGFVRTSDGAITTFDAPGDANGTHPVGINDAGTVAGHYCDASLCHGFVRTADGTINTFDVPGAAGGTYPNGIGPQGAVTGYYWDAQYYAFAFVRAADGHFTKFQMAGAANGTDAINISRGGMAGMYVDATYTAHGFFGTDGVMTSFDPPGSLGVSALPYSFGTGLAVNAAGTVAGYYFESISGNPFGGNYRGFLRTPDGNFTTFDAGSEATCCLWTFTYDVNSSGVAIGSYNDDTNSNYGFIRATDGTITVLDAPGAGLDNPFMGTAPQSINDHGEVAGYYMDTNFAVHGFIYRP